MTKKTKKTLLWISITIIVLIVIFSIIGASTFLNI